MLELVKTASLALAQHDADTLQSLLQTMPAAAPALAPADAEKVTAALRVLSRQLSAAERHLGVSSRERFTQRSTPWEP